MNPTNILADTVVEHFDGNFASIYLIQRELQNRLGKRTGHMPGSKENPAPMAIYWGHCIRAESEELIEWLEKHGDPTALKEMQMEAVDILHFVMNMALEIGISDEDIHYISLSYSFGDWADQTAAPIMGAIGILNQAVVHCIDTMPWKTWKTYKEPMNMAATMDTYADVFSACLMVCNACGLSKQETLNMYYAKNKVNHQRQDNGY